MPEEEDNPPSKWERLKARLKDRGARIYKALKSYTIILVLTLVLIVAYLWPRIFINVYAGEHSVLWLRFGDGTQLEAPYGEGLHIIYPWDKMYIYSTRIQHVSHNFDALSKNGLPVRFEVSIRYRPHIDNLPRLHQEIGPEYVEKVVKPEVQAHVREVVGNYLPEEIYTAEGLIMQIIRQGALAGLDRRDIILDDLLIKRMELPERIRTAIEDKLKAEQLSLQYDFLLQKEVKEADRKRIEASGYRDFQRIVKNAGPFSEFLNWRGVIASLELAKSKNSKVVVMGNKDSAVPLVFSMPVDKPQTSENTQAGQTSPNENNSAADNPEVAVQDLLSPSTLKLIEESGLTLGPDTLGSNSSSQMTSSSSSDRK